MSKEVTLHVDGSFAGIEQRITSSVLRFENGESVEATHLTFESWEALTRTMTTERLALLRHLHRTPSLDVSTLAGHLGRDASAVQNDIDVLSDAGLISAGDTGLRADYDEIQTTIAL